MTTQTKTITTPSGATVEIADVLQLTGREQLRYLTDMYESTVDAPVRTGALDDLVVRAVIYRHLIIGWSYTDEAGEPLPTPSKDNDTSLDIPIADARAIWEVVKDEVGYLVPTFEPTTETEESDPKVGDTTE